MEHLKSYKVRPTKLNLLHNRIRSANALKLEELKMKLYKEYKQKGGRRSLIELLNTNPIYLNKFKKRKR